MYFIYIILGFFFFWIAGSMWLAWRNDEFGSPWEQGICRGWKARRDRFNGKVYFEVADQWGNKHYYLFTVDAWREFKKNTNNFT